jgi:peptide/nickel transport system substrate-binding protein
MRRVAWLLAGSLGACACGAPPEQVRARSAPELNVAVQGDITGLYPALRNESFSFAVNANVFEGLTSLGRDLAPQPALADAWENPDEHTWLFHLRPGVRFSDTQPVRARDVVASLRFAMTADATRTLLAPVESVDSPSEEQVRVRTRFPCPVLLSHLAFAYVLPESALASPKGPPAPGTGPLRVESWQPGRELVVVRNSSFRGTPPDFERVRFVVTPDPAARLAALRAGRVDIADNVPNQEIEALRRSPSLRVVSRPGLRVLFLALPVDVAPFTSPRVREAIDLALDRPELVKRALGGFGAPASQLVPPPVLGYNPDIPVTGVNRARARELLRAAGVPAGVSLRLEGPTNRYPSGVEIMAEVARQLGEVGLRVAVEARPKEEFFEDVDAGRYQLLLYGWSCETVQAGEALDELIHTPPAGKGRNIEHFSDPAIDRLIDTANRSSSLRERGARLAQALAAVSRARPVIPLAIQNESFAFSAERVAWDPSLDMALHMADVHRAPPAPLVR